MNSMMGVDTNETLPHHCTRIHKKMLPNSRIDSIQWFWLQALLEAHDKIADKLGPQEGTSRSLTEAAPWEEIRPAGSILKPTKDKSNMSVDSEDSNVQYAQPIRIISLRKSPSQPLVSFNALFVQIINWEMQSFLRLQFPLSLFIELPNSFHESMSFEEH